jgi:hypothetical protein
MAEMTDKEYTDLLDRLQIDDMVAVVNDVVGNTKPEDSVLHYTPDLLAYRKIAEREVAATPDGSYVDIPNV